MKNVSHGDRALGAPNLSATVPRALKPADLTGSAASSAAIAGFIATAAMSMVVLAGYAVAVSLGSVEPGASLVQRWMWGLAHNSLTQATQTLLPIALGIHFLAGIAWAMVYAAFAQHRLHGPGWRRGMLFSLVPWGLSVVLFLPLVGGGPFGFAFDAGPLPIFGNLMAHLIYGALLGQMYGPWGERLLSGKATAANPEEARLIPREERAIAIGISAGLAGGGLLGWLASIFNVVAFSLGAASLLGAVGGSLIGAFVASYVGLSQKD